MRAEAAGHRPFTWRRAPALRHLTRWSRLLRRSLAWRALARGRASLALTVTRGEDALILAALGMHDAALSAFGDRPPRTAGEVLACIGSLAATGQSARAASLARTSAAGRSRSWRRRAAGCLAGLDDRAALDLLGDDHEAPLRAALLLRTGAPAAALRSIHLINRRPSADLDLLEANVVLERSDLVAHQRLINQALARHDLEPVARPACARPVSVRNIATGTPERHEGPLVSVVMSARNVAGYVDVAVGSILAQTWRSLELIVVDDGSTDGTGRFLDAWMVRDPRLRVVLRAAPGGAYAARNAGIALARGTFLTFHDADDFAHPRRIERQVRPLLADRRLVASAARWFRIDEGGRVEARQVWPLVRWHPASTLFRRQPVLDRLGGFDPVLSGADCEYWARLREVFGSRRVLDLRAPLTIGAARPGSLTRAPGTGYGRDGSAPTRLAYWEAWRRWHARARRSGQPLRLGPGEPRPFEAPAALTAASPSDPMA